MIHDCIMQNKTAFVRRALGMSQIQLANTLGVTRGYVAILENTKPGRISKKLRKRIANAMDVDEVIIFGGDVFNAENKS